MQWFGKNIGNACQIEYTNSYDRQDEEKQHPVEGCKKRFDGAWGDEFHS